LYASHVRKRVISEALVQILNLVEDLHTEALTMIDPDKIEAMTHRMDSEEIGVILLNDDMMTDPEKEEAENHLMTEVGVTPAENNLHMGLAMDKTPDINKRGATIVLTHHIVVVTLLVDHLIVSVLRKVVHTVVTVTVVDITVVTEKVMKGVVTVVTVIPPNNVILHSKDCTPCLAKAIVHD